MLPCLACWLLCFAQYEQVPLIGCEHPYIIIYILDLPEALHLTRLKVLGQAQQPNFLQGQGSQCCPQHANA